MSLYLDASVLVPTITEEPSSASVDAVILANTGELIVSEYAVAEVASALSRLVRMGRLDEPDAKERLADFDGWRASGTDPADVIVHDCRLANTYVRRFELKLRAPDALHLAICRRLGLQLATLDRRLATAARELGIEALIPGERQ
jgi:predicted nucleic acid-binding protein